MKKFLFIIFCLLFTMEGFAKVKNDTVKTMCDSSVRYEQTLKERLDSTEREVVRLRDILSTHTCCIDKHNSIIRNQKDRIQELDSTINKIKADQLDSYALPFSILFDCNSYQIKETDIETLNEIASIMKKDGGKFKVVGFASSDGSCEHNFRLAEKRVNEVVKYLVRHGVNRDNIEVVPKGETDSHMGALNRRVSFYKSI